MKEAKTIIQSFVFSRMHSDLNIHEMRILLRIIERAQDEIRGVVLAGARCRMSHQLAGKEIIIPIRAIMAPGSHHYELAKEACRSIMGKIVEYFDTTNNSWQAATMIPFVEIDGNEGVVRMHILEWVWSNILDFTKGYVQFDLGIALRLRNANALKLYFMMSNQKMPIVYKISELRKLFGTGDKYKKNNDFIRQVIMTASKELKEKAPWACDIRPMKEGREIDRIMFFPYEQKEKYSPTVAEKKMIAISGGEWYDRRCYEYLRYSIGFEAEELRRNKAIVEEFAKEVKDPIYVLADMRTRARRRDGEIGKGWFINAMKSEIKYAKESKKLHQGNEKAHELAKAFRNNGANYLEYE